MTALLLVGVALAAGIWYYVSQQKKQKRWRAEELTRAINDSYSYIDGGMVTLDGVEETLSETGSVEETIAEIRRDFEDVVADTPGVLALGSRPVNMLQGIELDESIRQFEDEISTTKEFKEYKKKQKEMKTRLGVWQKIADQPLPVILGQGQRDRHVYVVGKTGSGKTTLLTWMALQDLINDQGVAFLTPEAETIEQELLPHIPSWRREEVIYFNPADENCRFSFNPLHRRPGEDIDRKVEAVFTSLTRLMESGSARINQILRQTIYALVELPNTTLLDVPRLLDRDNPSYRRQVVNQLEDKQTKQFWASTYEGLPRNAHVPILTRLAKFIRPRSVRNILCRPEPGIDFREVIDSGKILLGNLSDGLLGESVSQLLGGLVMSELQLAAVSRADVPRDERPRCHVYLDEFHSFTAHANVSYEKLLSRARKYRLPLTLAHQQTGQLPSSLMQEVFGNVSTLVSFLVSRRDAERIGRECIRDDQPGRQTVDAEDLVTLDVGNAFTKIGTHAFPMRVTTTLADFDEDPAMRDRIIADSRRRESQTRAGSAETAVSGTSDRSNGESPAEEGVPADPFADLDDPQDLY